MTRSVGLVLIFVLVSGCAQATATPVPITVAATASAATPIPPAAASQTAVDIAISAAATAQIATVLAVRVATPRPTPTPGLAFDFDSSVKPEEQALIVEGMNLAKKHLGDVGSMIVYASRDTSPLCNAYRNQTQQTGCAALQFGSAVALGSAMFLNFSRETWGDTSRVAVLHTVIHEYAHVVQDYNANGRAQKLTYPLKGPSWLTEGSAEFFSWGVMDRERNVPFASTRDEKIEQARQVSTPLQTTLGGLFENYRNYSLGFLAVEFLSSNYGGDETIWKYFYTLSQSSSWQNAFKMTFGISIEDFYAEFVRYRQKNFPPSQ